MDSPAEAGTSPVPTIAIVVPVYRGAQHIPHIVSACTGIRQIHRSLVTQLIFACDDPVDNSIQIIREYSASNDWISHFTLSCNRGQHVATAAGIMNSQCEWIATIDEDLQFNPGEIPRMLEYALEDELDLVYAISRTTLRGRHSKWRNIGSTTSKILMGLITKDDYRNISSFRLIRGDIAISAACTVDKFSFLDAELIGSTSSRRRGYIYSNLKDQRDASHSGYSYRSLIRHYGRFITSVSLSATSLLTAFVIAATFIGTCLLAINLLIGLANDSQVVAPGWASIITAIIVGTFSILVLHIAGLKLISIIVQRSTGLPSFLIVDRQNDRKHLNALKSVLAASRQ